MLPYLTDLTLRLAAAAADLPAPFRERHTRYFVAAQRDDGGFAGREGGSDLYYTSFALRGLAILGSLHGNVAERAQSYLRTRLTGDVAVVDFFSLIFSAAMIEAATGTSVFAEQAGDWRDRIATALADLRRDDGGFAKGAAGVASSTYHSFLVLLCSELIEREIADPEALARFILAQHREDGGFVEIRAARRSGTNPTAAAIAALTILHRHYAVDRLTPEIRDATIDFLAAMQDDDGGLRANTRIPIADLLSTFTGTLTLEDLGGTDAVDLGALASFVQGLEQSSGGFHGATWDEEHDVEYSFYGAGATALLGKSTLDAST